MIHIAHEEGFAVMAHVNGAQPVLDAVEAGVDSVEHGNCMDQDCLQAMAEHGTVWVPTHVTIANLLRSSRFEREVIENLRKKQADNIKKAFSTGVSVAAGSDAGAYMVPHAEGTLDEYRALQELAADPVSAAIILEQALHKIRHIFVRSL